MDRILGIIVNANNFVEGVKVIGLAVIDRGNGIDAVEVTLHFWDTGQMEPI